MSTALSQSGLGVKLLTDGGGRFEGLPLHLTKLFENWRRSREEGRGEMAESAREVRFRSWQVGRVWTHPCGKCLLGNGAAIHSTLSPSALRSQEAGRKPAGN